MFVVNGGSRAILNGVFAHVMVGGVCRHYLKAFQVFRFLLEARPGPFGVFSSFVVLCLIIKMSVGALCKLKTFIRVVFGEFG